MENAAIALVPGEIIEYILEVEQVDFRDVVRLSLTCKQLYDTITNSSKLWKTKFFQRWPSLREAYKEMGRLDDTVTSWKDEAQASSRVRQKMLEFLSLMSSKHYNKSELSTVDFQEFDSLVDPEQGAHPAAYHFLIDELMSIIKRPKMISNLTHRYYAHKVIRHLKQNFLKGVWMRFANLPPKQQTLDYAATFVSQWSQPQRQISYTHVSKLIDNIADQVKEVLKQQHPTHSIFSTSQEKLDYWKHNNIDDNQWNVAETKQVADTLCEVLFHKLDFHGNNEMYYSSKNSFIDRVLQDRRGIPITLAIVYESVARRLGIRCEPVCFPSHFLLRWKQNYTSPESQNLENYYIDVIDGGRFITKENCPRIGGTQRCPIEKYNVHKAASAVEVTMRMANNLVVADRQRTHLNGRVAKLRSAIELQHMIQPNDTNVILQLGRFYMMHEIHSADMYDKLLHLAMTTRDEPESRESREAKDIALTLAQQRYMQRKKEETKVEKRCPDVTYAVGLTLMHWLHGYQGVVTGYDTKCKLSEWLPENITELTHGTNQPFYYMLVDDGSCRYIAQENLVIPPEPDWVDHYEIGRYFYKWCARHYLPNEELLREYPEEEELRNEWAFGPRGIHFWG